MRELSSELIYKYSKECESVGFKYLGRGSKKDYSLAKCNACGDVNSYRQDAMRNGRVACSNCLETKWTRECLAQGFKFLGKVDGKNTLCECLKCGHQDVYYQGDMRRGQVACSNCLETKWTRECLAQGFKFLGKVDGKNSLCECLKCGHQDVYNQSAMRNGRVACSNCSPGHWNEPSWFYIARITPINAEPIIKIGVSNNPVQRYTHYGLRDGTILEELTKVMFQTKLEAIGYESAVIKFLEPYHIKPDEAKTILAKSGWTECFTIESLNHLLDDRGFHQLSLTSE